MGESTRPSSWFELPASIRRLFARFPLKTYPQETPQPPSQNVFYSFQGTNDDLSFNPTCLRWQTLLKFHNIPHEVRSSSNHASPSGQLPFILPTDRPTSPVTASKIPRWITSQQGREETIHRKEEAYTALVDRDIRSAWLYFLYLQPENFREVAYPLYCASASSNILVQQSIARQLKNAARDELLKSFTIIDPTELYDRASKAFQALSTLLGDNDHFFGASSPGLFDASVFAYTYLLLTSTMPWVDTQLADFLEEHPNLVQHRERLLQRYFT